MTAEEFERLSEMEQHRALINRGRPLARTEYGGCNTNLYAVDNLFVEVLVLEENAITSVRVIEGDSMDKYLTEITLMF